MSQDKIDVSLVIACYNEEPLLVDSVEAVVETLDNTRWNYELIFIDDCSQDRTREIIDELLLRYPDHNFRKLFHARNRGRGRTVTDGFQMARGDIVGYIDIDLEVHVRYVPTMVTAIQNGADVATAHRIYKVQLHLFNRFLLSTGYTRLMRQLLGVNLKDTETGFKFFKRDRILPILEQIEDEHWFWDTEIMVRSLLAGYQIEEIPCLFVRRYDKRSSVNVVKDTADYLLKLWRFRSVVAGIRRGAGQGQIALPPSLEIDSS